MANSRTFEFHRDPFQPQPLTPGPLGHNDAASPDTPEELIGDTPGPLGMNDYADPSLASIANRSKTKRFPSAIFVSQRGLDFIMKEEYVKKVSNQLHWPGGTSGVTLGAGYDMKCRSKTTIIRDLTAIGLNYEVAEIAAHATGLSGEEAKKFVRKHSTLIRIDEAMATCLLRVIIRDYERIVKKHVKVPLQQHEYDALLSFAYNPGGRFVAVAKLLNRGDVSGAMKEMCRANTSGGYVLEGLTRRRNHETALYMKGVYRT